MKKTAVLLFEEGAAFARLEEAAIRRAAFRRNTMTDTHETAEPQGAPREGWDAIAADYDTFVAPREAPLATAALELAGLGAGERFLDVAAGPGGLSLPAARLGARVVATDWSPQMIERFEARVRDEGLDAQGRVMDCHALDFPDASFDVTGSLFGVMLVPDQPAALREMVRVTRPGGRVLLIAYGAPSKFQALQIFIDVLRVVTPEFGGLPDDPGPLEFQVADPEVMRRRLIDAGLEDVSIDTGHEEVLELRSGQELWDWCVGGNPIPGMLVAGLGDDRRAMMIGLLDDAVRGRADDSGVAVLTAAINVGVGTRPAARP